MDIDKELDELLDLLDKNIYLQKLDSIKRKINKDLLEKIEDYRLCPTVSKKEKLYEDSLFQEYIKCEQEVNYLIMEINQIFKRGKICESNKW